MPLTNYADSALNKLLFGNTAYSIPATHYFALSTTTPTQAGTNFTEPSGNAYARVGMTNNTTNFVPTTAQPGTGQSQSNGVAVTFAAATGGAASWGTVTNVGVYDALTNGNLLAYAALTVAQTIGGGDTFSLPIQNFSNALN